MNHISPIKNIKAMWCDELPAGQSWTCLWHNLIICPKCSGIRNLDKDCSVCADSGPSQVTWDEISKQDGTKVKIRSTFMGAEGRLEDYVYLNMLEREWKRPILDPVYSIDEFASPKAAIVLLFWSYFESRIERLLRKGMQNVPPNLAEDTLSRHSSVGARLNRLYQVLFGTTYLKDLSESGFSTIASHLSEVQQRRNEFTHGNPSAIDDALVRSVIEHLKAEHEAWIAVYNKTVARVRK